MKIQKTKKWEIEKIPFSELEDSETRRGVSRTGAAGLEGKFLRKTWFWTYKYEITKKNSKIQNEKKNMKIYRRNIRSFCRALVSSRSSWVVLTTSFTWFRHERFFHFISKNKNLQNFAESCLLFHESSFLLRKNFQNGVQFWKFFQKNRKIFNELGSIAEHS